MKKSSNQNKMKNPINAQIKLQTEKIKTFQSPDAVDSDNKILYMNIDEDILIVNTDDKNSPQPGDSMSDTRTSRMTATLGPDAELISIAVQAYNQLEKAKICVECILKYSTDIDYELILFDNGSTDGTLEYFKSVQYHRKKIIRVTKNIGSAVNLVYNHFNGRYLAYVMGDVFVTKNWLTNLRACMKSDATIGMVVPVASNVKFQGIDIIFNSFEEMQMKAAGHNISNPSLWNERLTLFPSVGFYRREALEIAGVGDSGFFHYFGDNDFSFRIRRAGYKLMLCKDTFIHHDHRSNPAEKDRVEAERSMEAGRRDFKNKYFGIDAWKDINNFEPVMISLINPQEHNGFSGIEILGVDVLCGTPILEIKNKLREIQINDARLSAFSTNAKYWLDLKTICSGDLIVDRIEFLNEYFPNKQFDYIFMGTPINSYHKPLKLLDDLLKCLNPNGHLLIKLRNTFDITSCFKTLGAHVQVDDTTTPVYQLSLDDLINHVKKAGFIDKKIVTENWPLEEKNLQVLRNAITTIGFSHDPNDVFVRAITRDYVIDIAQK
jgi:GT2 family glycosyltransferase